VDKSKTLPKPERALSKKEEMPKELRNTAIIMDGILTLVLLAIYRENFPLSALFITPLPAFFLALAWLETIRRLRNKTPG
jgi:hypothetical protein